MAMTPYPIDKTNTYILAAHIVPISALKYIAYSLPQDAYVEIANMSIQEIEKLKLPIIHHETLEGLAESIIRENPPEKNVDSTANHVHFFGLPQAQFTFNSHELLTKPSYAIRPLDSIEYKQFIEAWQNALEMQSDK